MAKKRAKTKRRGGLSHDEALVRLAELQARLRRMAEEYTTLSRGVAAEVAKLREPVTRLGQSLQGLRLAERSLQRIVDKGPAREKPVREMVENPHRSDDLVADELAAGDGSAGLNEVDVNLSTRIGGLARLSAHLDECQLVAAAKFRSCWDQAQIGGARAIDYTTPRVDTSGSGVADMVDRSGDALAGYSRAVQALGMVQANLVQRVICEDMSLRQLARLLGRPVGGRHTERLRDELLAAVDGLVAVFGTRAEGRWQRVRSEAGERLPMPVGTLEVVYSSPGAGERNNKAA